MRCVWNKVAKSFDFIRAAYIAGKYSIFYEYMNIYFI